MRARPLFWFVLCLLCLAGAWLFWRQPANPRTKPSAPARIAAVPTATIVRSASTAPQFLTAALTNGAVSGKTNQFAYRLSNTTKTLDRLTGDRHAILLENAFIDTGSPLTFSIPAHLHSPGDPGAYIVQARGPIDAAFRAMLAAAGAEIVSYIPNDAYLVRAQAGVANRLAANPLTQSVLPYEPYYKIQSSLLTLATGQMNLPDEAALNLGLFPGTAPATIAQIEKLGGKIVSQGTSPFGPVLQVIPPKNWTVLATLPGVQIVEPFRQRIHANDLSRATIGVASDTQVSSNYMNLTGAKVLVEVNDTGIDANHPDLIGRIFGAPLVDTDGHGTHVAGIIAGNGTESMTVTNASGSILPASTNQFRGMAPAAHLLSMDFNDSDQDLQSAAAQTNALISNNSWNYGAPVYDLAAASYDAAVRDALPTVTGSQPVLFVFSAGNAGDGATDGSGGNPDTILSPATAKNVITVGALEQARNITNKVSKVVNGVTNVSAVWQPTTDTSYEVADFSSRGNVGIGVEGTAGRFKPDVVAPGTFVISTRSEQWDEKAYYNPTNYAFTFFTNQVVGVNSLTPYSLFVQENAVSVAVLVLQNISSTLPFPDNLPVYVRQAAFPTTNTFDFVTTSNGFSIPPNSGGAIANITSVQGLGFNYAVGNTNSTPVNYNLLVEVVTTNDLGDYFQVLSNLNQSIGTFNPVTTTNPGPYYRYESGTSMSAAGVSGMLALMQDYFTNTLQATPSPALLKGLVINGARATGFYDLQVQSSINFAGWGQVNLPNSLPLGMTTNLAATSESMLMLDQSPALAVATGDKRTYFVTIDPTTDAQFLPLRVTLTWTDPPGDPVAAIKLVNSLELVVTNFDNPTNPVIFYGNDIAAGNKFNTPEGTNAPVVDAINNVQNVFISSQLGTNYSITVIGRSVNVNAVTAHPNNVVQDYALVISCGEGEVTNAFTVTTNASSFVSNPTADQQITYVGGVNAPLLNQLVGASTPLLGTNLVPLGPNLAWGGTNAVVTLGMTNQWHFYVVTNTTGFTNAAFVTFLPPTLSLSRMGVFGGSAGNATRPEADIDLYVTTDPTLTNLNAITISNCINGPQVGASVANVFNGASLGRGGTEFVADTNSNPSVPGQVYYVGVYAEDQEASEYGFVTLFSEQPFSQLNPDGSQSVHGVPVPLVIPDGNPAQPGYTNVFALALYPMQVSQVVVTNIIGQQNGGDLVASLFHSVNGAGLNASPVILMNHHSPNAPGTYTFIYDDSGFGNIIGSQPTAGPGSLNAFVGQQGNGPWILKASDSTPGFVGSVQGYNLLIEPHRDLKDGVFGTVQGGSWFYDFIDVPEGATNLSLFATNLTVVNYGPIFLYVNTNSVPTLTNFIATVGLTNPPTAPPPPPGGTISLGPPLAPGRYWIGIWNPNVAPQNFFIIAKLGLVAAPQVIFSSAGPVPILDDAVTTNNIYVTSDKTVSSVEVALRVDHPRVSDLVFHLISPNGTRSLLVENRGGTTTNGMGSTLAITNITPATSSGNGSASTNVIETGQIVGSLQISYNFYNVPDEMVVQYQGTNAFDSGIISGSGVFTVNYGPGTNTQLTIIMNPYVNPGSGDLWDYTVTSAQVNYTYLVLTEDTNKTTTPIKFAPVPFQGVLTNLVTTNTVVTTVSVTNGPGWHNSFEGAGNVGGQTGYFRGGWHVDVANIDIYTTGTPNPPPGSTADEGTNFIDLDGSGIPANSTISTNIATVPGKNYTLSFTYSRNPEGSPPASAQALQNGNPLLSVTHNTANAWTSLGWATTSVVFTATTPITTLSFKSLDPVSDNFGVLLDCVDLASSDLNDGFENTTATNYAQGVNPGFGSWAVTANQVTVISNASLAVEGSNLLALADGVISRVMPTVPGGNYTLSYAYRGPGATALWRGESNYLDSINGNNGSITAGSVTYTQAEVRLGYNFDGGANRLVVPDSPTLNFGANQDFSIDGWIMLLPPVSEPQNVITFVDKRLAPDSSHCQGHEFGLFNNQLNLRISSSVAGNGNNWGGGPGLLDGKMHHVAVTLARNSTTGGRMYVDGQPVVLFDPTSVPGDLTTTQPLHIGNHPDPTYTAFFKGPIDEVSLYQRALSASEIKAIYNHGSSGKYVTNAPSIAQGLAEAQVTLGGVPYPPFFGSNTSWQTNTINFIATQSNTVLQVTGLEPGMLLDNFSLAQLVLVTNTVVTTNLVNNDVFYLPEQTLDTYAGLNALGSWQLEVQDNRVGATNPAPSLVSWQLRFNFSTPSNPIGPITNGLPVTNVIAAGSIAYYLINVPTNADIATNILISPNGALNLWFNLTTPPSGTNSTGDYLLLGGSTNGTSILYTNGLPPIFVPGGSYYLAVQNTNAFAVTNYILTVDFHLQSPSVAAGGIVYYLITVPTNADFATNTLVFATGPLNIWFTTNSPPSVTNLNDILLLPDLTYPGGTNGSVVLSAGTTPPLIPGSTYYLGVQNTNSFAVTYAIQVDFHLFIPGPILGPFITATNISGTFGFLITWFAPTNDLFKVQWTGSIHPPVAWNTFSNLISYTGPVTTTNGWFSFFDDGSQTGGFGPARFYRLLLVQSANFLTLPSQTNRTVNPLATLVVTNTATDSDTNATLVYSLTTSPPNGASINASGIITWSPSLAQANTINTFTTVVTDNGVPPAGATNTFIVTVGPPPPIISSVAITTNGLFQLQWTAPTNYQFQLEWTTNLAAPVVWNYIPPVPPWITSTNTTFTFVDTNAPTQSKFYRLIQQYP